jgi:hypothetical protein
VWILESAHAHGVSDEDIRHAVTNAIRLHDLDEGMVMVVGPSTSAAMIEVGVVTSEDDEPIVVHAMPARAKFL